MRFKASWVVLSLVAVLSLVRAEDENPYKTAKVGDWVEWTTSMKGDAFSFDGGMKQTVINKTDSEVTVEVAMKTPAGEVKQQMKINLNEKYDPRKPVGDSEATVKELEKGEETVTVAGKTLKTTWTKYEVTTKKGPLTSMTGKAWVSKDVPLGGMVKAEQDLKGFGKQIMELKDFGSGK